MARFAHKPLAAFCIFSIFAGAAFACSGVDSDLFSGTPSDGGTVSDAGTDAKTTRDSGKSDSGSGGGGGTDSGGGGGGGGGGGTIVPAVCGDGTATCSSGDPTCCATQGDGFTTVTSYSCTSNPGSCNAVSQASIECRDNNDCSGGTPFCCGELLDVSGQGGYRGVLCESSCDAHYPDGGLSPQVPFCSDATPNACTASGFTCQASSPLPGFDVCGQD